MSKQSDWRMCLDFGTGASKVSVCAPPQEGGAITDFIRPLRLGAVTGAPDAFMTPSALHVAQGRVTFGSVALRRFEQSGGKGGVLRSFKMFLAAPDLSTALDTKLKPTIDPTGLFTQRDALTAYSAHLLYAAEQAARGDIWLPDEARDCPRRYAHPAWRSGSSAHAAMGAMFAAAEELAETFGPALLSEEGVDAHALRAALDAPRIAALSGRIEMAVFEARAAAVSHFMASSDLPDEAMVIDMGAGTTDLTAFKITRTPSGAIVAKEIVEARRTLFLGGDDLDAIVCDIASERLPSKLRTAAWPDILTQARGIKEALFRFGAAEFRYPGKRATLRRDELARHTTYKACQDALLSALRASLAVLGARRRKVGVILAGGGANTDFVTGALPRASIKRAELLPLAPPWAHAHALGPELARIFPQMAISIGGALVDAQQP